MQIRLLNLHQQAITLAHKVEVLYVRVATIAFIEHHYIARIPRELKEYRSMVVTMLQLVYPRSDSMRGWKDAGGMYTLDRPVQTQFVTLWYIQTTKQVTRTP